MPGEQAERPAAPRPAAPRPAAAYRSRAAAQKPAESPEEMSGEVRESPGWLRAAKVEKRSGARPGKLGRARNVFGLQSARNGTTSGRNPGGFQEIRNGPGPPSEDSFDGRLGPMTEGESKANAQKQGRADKVEGNREEISVMTRGSLGKSARVRGNPEESGIGAAPILHGGTILDEWRGTSGEGRVERDEWRGTSGEGRVERDEWRGTSGGTRGEGRVERDEWRDECRCLLPPPPHRTVRPRFRRAGTVGARRARKPVRRPRRRRTLAGSPPGR
eukprot:gene12284-biopygen10306